MLEIEIAKVNLPATAALSRKSVQNRQKTAILAYAEMLPAATLAAAKCPGDRNGAVS